MKHFKKLTTVLLAAALFLTPFASNVLTVHAEEPVTYYVKYVPDIDEWRFQLGTWQEGGYHRELYYLKENIKDGDVMVVEGTDSTLTLEVDVRLSNLTFMKANAIVTAKSVDDCYVLFNSWAVTNGDVTNAYVYDSAVCNFNNNVTNLEVISTGTLLSATLGVSGTVGHLKAYDPQKLHFEFYNFAQDTLRIQNGVLKTDASHYSTTAPAESTPPAQNNTPSTTPPAENTSSGEYDDVPKTGLADPTWMLLAAAAACIVASRKCKHNS